METSYPRFIEGIRKEHFDEASFLYEQRVALLGSQALPWPDLDDFEQRQEAHLDALVVAGSSALGLACRSVVLDEPGTIYVALSLACRLRRADAMATLLGQLDTAANLAGVKAAVDALATELPDEWTHFVDTALHRQQRLVPVLAQVAGRRRLPVGEAMEAALERAGEAGTEALVTALGQLGQSSSRRSLQAYLQHPQQAIRRAALLSLLRTGDSLALHPWHANTLSEGWPLAALALGGDCHASALIAASMREGLEPLACLESLGQLGDPATLQVLYDALKTPEQAIAASKALHRLTGAELHEEVFRAEQVDESELFDDELQAWRERKQAPTRGDGRPYGEAARELSADRARWSPWLSQNVGRFVDGTRFRRGRLCTPEVLLAELRDPQSAALERQSAADELAIRYGCPIALDTSMWVAAQKKALHGIAAWVEAEGSRFAPGGWYMAGSPQ